MLIVGSATFEATKGHRRHIAGPRAYMLGFVHLSCETLYTRHEGNDDAKETSVYYLLESKSKFSSRRFSFQGKRMFHR